MRFSSNDLVKCIARELALRRNVYRRRVESEKMKQETADREIAQMQQVFELLVALEHILCPSPSSIEIPDSKPTSGSDSTSPPPQPASSTKS